MGRDRTPPTPEEPGETATDEREEQRPRPSPSRADGPPGDPYADSPGASVDRDDAVEPNEPA